MGNRRIEIVLPVAGFAAGLALLCALGGRAASATGVPSEAWTRPASADSLGSVSGVVQDKHGDPIPGARVYVLGNSGEVVAEQRAVADTDGVVGTFHIDQLPAGTYVIAASAPDSGDMTRIARVPVSNFGDTRVRIRLDLGY